MNDKHNNGGGTMKYKNTDPKWGDDVEVTADDYRKQADVFGVSVTVEERDDGIYIDDEQVAVRVQAEIDRKEQARKDNEKAQKSFVGEFFRENGITDTGPQRIFFVKPGVLNQAKGEE